MKKPDKPYFRKARKPMDSRELREVVVESNSTWPRDFFIFAFGVALGLFIA
jgi:hypothetical protein